MDNNQELILNNTSKKYLKEIARWSYFLSIVGFITLGLIILFAFFIKALFSFLPDVGGDNFSTTSFPFMMLSMVYFVIALFYFFPIFYLYKSSSKMKTALQNNNHILLEDSFKNLKSHYKFIGITTLVIIAIYTFVFLGAIFINILSL